MWVVMVGVGRWPVPGYWRVGSVMSVCVVSLDDLCRWQASVYCARRIPRSLVTRSV